MKSKEELNALKEEVKNLNEKLSALTDEELAQVTGGAYNNGLTDQYTGSGDYIYPGYPKDYYTGSHWPPYRMKY